jgi:hypothetical protein
MVFEEGGHLFPVCQEQNITLKVAIDFTKWVYPSDILMLSFIRLLRVEKIV